MERVLLVTEAVCSFAAGAAYWLCTSRRSALSLLDGSAGEALDRRVAQFLGLEPLKNRSAATLLGGERVVFARVRAEGVPSEIFTGGLLAATDFENVVRGTVFELGEGTAEVQLADHGSEHRALAGRTLRGRLARGRNSHLDRTVELDSGSQLRASQAARDRARLQDAVVSALGGDARDLRGEVLQDLVPVW